MDVEREIEGLYAVPLEEFTLARNELARRLKDAGEPDATARVKKLKKPSVSAWAVNQLARQESAGVARLLELVEELKEARGSSEIHSLGAERRELVAKMARRAGELMEAAGHAASPGTLQRVTGTLQAGGEDEERDLLRRGVLSNDLSPAGFDALNPFAAFEETTPRPAAVDEELEDLRRAAAEAEEEAARLTEDAERAEAAAVAASEAASEARRRARAAREKAQRAARSAG